MIGNPYKMITKTRQTVAFELNNYTSISIKEIELFVEKFPGQRIDPIINDIFISDLTLQGARLLDNEELNSYYLSVYAPQGSYFGSGNNAKELPLKAEFKIKGKTVSPESYKINFYWFKENPSVTTESPYYCSLGGQGWECLNEKKETILDSAEGEEGKVLIQWQASGDSFIIKKSDVVTKELKYKCVAVYGDSPFERTKLILNFDANYEIILSSSEGTTFYMDKGITTLSCIVKEQGIEVPEEECTFNWYSTSPNAGYTIEKISKESSYLVDISNYTSYVEFKCAVFRGTNYLGYGVIKLFNLLESPLQNYTLSIVNGTQIFKYNTEGLSPFTVSQDKIDLAIDKEAPALTFNIFDNKTGATITEENFKEKASSVAWYIPKEKTMLSIEKSLLNPEEIKINGLSYYKVIGTSLKYSIANSFNRYNDNNTIWLEVKYDGEILKQATSFLFIKEGDNGTNGTNYVCKIIPMSYPELGSKNEALDIPFIINRKALDYGWYYPLNIQNKNNPNWFDIEIWRDGEKITFSNEEAPVVKWSLMESLGINADKRNTYYHVTDNQFYLSPFPASETEFKENTPSYDNITKVEVSLTEQNIQSGTSKERILYATLPVGAIYNSGSNSIQLVRTSGFRYVIYESDGTSPSYNNQNPFEVRMLNDQGEDVTENYHYYWSIEGGYTNLEGKYVKSNDLILRKAGTVAPKTENDDNVLYENQAEIQPAQTYNGLSVSNAVVCRVCVKAGDDKPEYDPDLLVSAIRIPIHSYINRFGHAAINGWDGNTIQINQEGGIVLAPQVGAGSKNAKNEFTGILMGEAILNKQHKNGLIGFHEGEQSIFLDAKTGAASFGKQGNGQIILDPSKEEAIIKSGNYDTSNRREGMAINLSEPSIRYGNGNFSVDANGVLSCKEATVNGNFFINAGSNSAYFTDSDMYIHFVGGAPEMETFIAPGFFSFTEVTPSGVDGQRYGIWWDGSSGPESGLNIRGNFSTSFTEAAYKEDDTEHTEPYQTGEGYIYFGSNGGMLISYENDDVTTDDETHVSCNLTPTSFSFMKEWKEENEYGIMKNQSSGIKFDVDSGLEVIGTITAKSGEIGGWLIEEDSISAKNGSMIIHSNGRISGLPSSDGGGDISGSMFSVGTSYKTGLKDGGLYIYGAAGITPSEYNQISKNEEQAKKEADKNGYTPPESTVFKNGNEAFKWGMRGVLDVYEYADYGPGVRLSSKNPGYKMETEEGEEIKVDTPIYFCVDGKIAMILQSSNDDDPDTLPDESKQRLFFPYSITHYQKNPDGSDKLDADGNKQVESIEQKEGTTLDRDQVYSNDFVFLKEDLKTNAQTAVSAINELASVPKKAQYKKGTGEYDTIKEYYDVIKKVKQEDGSIKNVKTEEIYEYHIGIVNRDEEDEEVTYIERQEVKDKEGNTIIKGFKMDLEGFFTGI